MENKNLQKTFFIIGIVFLLAFSYAETVTIDNAKPKIGDTILINATGSPLKIKIVDSVSNNEIAYTNSNAWQVAIDGSIFESGKNYTVIAQYPGNVEINKVFSVTSQNQISISDVPIFFIPIIALMVFLIVRKKQ